MTVSDPAEVTRGAMLETDHILLPTEGVGKAAVELMSTLSQAVAESPDDGILCGDSILLEHIMPVANSAHDSIAKSKFRDAFGGLLGVALFMTGNDTWLADNEVYLDWPKFSGIWDSLSQGWNTVLAQSDETLGLSPAAGIPGGYRTRLVQLLSDWVDATNSSLEDFDDHAHMTHGPTRLKLKCAGAIDGTGPKGKKQELSEG
eukprot:CAMPEP_0185198830 /NCGR_PEP_ID=MMETSP1140-20130426/43766_1 /TAXON_ID=298111 /ORGANISM="Pavlova sp., Strain CCMP459" /LENGTH=202 /DNA_ID=CAMNT_0027766055 /DNA_START=44 /DNA_END=649 /DNA_ORIENTATION=-